MKDNMIMRPGDVDIFKGDDEPEEPDEEATEPEAQEPTEGEA